MGNICSRAANKGDPTANPGRVLGSSDPNTQSQTPNRVSPPKSTNWKQTPGRTLGEPPAGGAQGAADEARSNAAIAAQKRAQDASANKGRLGSKLAAQKAKTQNQNLAEVSRDERYAREADQIAELRAGH